MPKVSIIVPVYNVEEYLRECLDSLINQTLRDIEIICVNDGSTDSSPQILSEYEQLDSRVRVINKPNAGYGHTMNMGLNSATGEYVGIVESDDYASLNMYEVLYNIAKQFDLDYIKADFYRFKNEGGNLNLEYNDLSNGRKYLYNRVLNPQDNLEIIKFIMNTWSGIYKREFLDGHNIRHNETPGASYQDNGFFFQTFCWAERVYFLDKPFYMNRRDNPNSSVMSKGKVFCMSDEYQFIRQFLERNPELKEKYITIYWLRKYHGYMFTYKRIGEEHKRMYLKFFSDEFKKALEDGELDQSLFTENEWINLNKIIEDPEALYFEKFIDQYRRMYNRTKNELASTRKELEKLKRSGFRFSNSQSKLSRVPRLARSAIRHCKNYGFVSAMQRAKDKLARNVEKNYEYKVSVVIPVYNAELYLSQCLDSIVSQTLKEIQIICVDDCSTDSTPDILKRYAARDNRITVITNKTNLRAGESRNRGIKIAKGEYLHFMDSDDYLELNAYEELYGRAKKHNLDLLQAKVHGIDFETSEEVANKRYNLTHLHQQDFDVKTNFHKNPEKFMKIMVTPWSSLYKNSMIKKYNIQFNDLICVNDRSFFNHAIISARSVMFMDHYFLYHRINNPNSLIGIRARNFDCHFKSYEIIKAQCSHLNKDELFYVLESELQDMFIWYNKYKRENVLAEKITAQVQSFVNKLDMSIFKDHLKRCRWLSDYVDLKWLPRTLERSGGVKVSVIIPVYNVEDYLPQCLDSVLGQTLKDIEVICVDDGSTDKSPEILKEYADKDSRVLVIHQENQFAGAARNKGLEIAKGEYLSFLDADDFFEPTMLQQSYAMAKEFDTDFVVFRSDSYFSNIQQYVPSMWTVKTNLLPADKVVFNYNDIKKDIFKVFTGWAWDKLYKREFVQSNKLLFQVQRTTNDLYFVYSALLCAKRICTLGNVLAHHRKNEVGTLSVTREKSIDCFYSALIALKKKLEELGVYEELERDYINYALHFSLWNLNTISGASYMALYEKLRTEYFEKLGITNFEEDYFYHSSEYEQYLKIMNNELQEVI